MNEEKVDPYAGLNVPKGSLPPPKQFTPNRKQRRQHEAYKRKLASKAKQEAAAKAAK